MFQLGMIKSCYLPKTLGFLTPKKVVIFANEAFFDDFKHSEIKNHFDYYDYMDLLFSQHFRI